MKLTQWSPLSTDSESDSDNIIHGSPNVMHQINEWFSVFCLAKCWAKWQLLRHHNKTIHKFYSSMREVRSHGRRAASWSQCPSRIHSLKFSQKEVLQQTASHHKHWWIRKRKAKFIPKSMLFTGWNSSHPRTDRLTQTIERCKIQILPEHSSFWTL